MSVEILTVSLSDESIEKIALLVAEQVCRSQMVTQSNPPSPQTPQPAQPQASAPQADPWESATPAPPAQEAPPPPVQAVVPAPTCAHGPMRYVPAGISKNSGRAYGAFWGCPAQRGQPQCKSVAA